MTKYALLIGINYKGTSSELNGCINDINNTSDVLEKIYKYKPSNILKLTDDSPKKPTANNIIKELYNLVIKTQTENVDQIWISYSGHGSYVKDTSGDEKDKKDEVIVPLDHRTKGVISDDLLNHIFSLMNPKTSCVSIFDCCHSGTILDLEYKYISGTKSVVENKKNKIKSNVIMISGCMDTQTSADAYNISNARKYQGAMTAALLTTLKQFDYNITCYSLLKHMRKFLLSKKFTQIPQITCSKALNNVSLFSVKDNVSYMKTG